MHVTCMQGGCNEEFNEDNVRDCVSEDQFKKYRRFQRNAMVDLDPDLRWCPDPACEGYVRKHRNFFRETLLFICDFSF